MIAAHVASYEPGLLPTGALERYLQIGCRVDGTGRGALALSARADEDALNVYLATVALPPETMSLVVFHARNSTRPDWHPEGPVRNTYCGGVGCVLWLMPWMGS